MRLKEESIWKKLNNAGRDPVDPNWLAEVYSVKLDQGLRMALAEKLGLMGSKSWPILKRLIHKEGIQPELIYAAGLCHQHEAKYWLLTQLEGTKGQDEQLNVLKALACWGGRHSYSLN